ncbi:MAG: 50S ribosomal protein L11 methyltransferase [Deltaproteobacteria bacterium]|jgi:ribosomal protein L11 methyltransferase|nr:50S ribosomal protein L11 methyltransferase [Deltaproteobacteria bacterium]
MDEYLQISISVPPPALEAASSALFEAGTTSLWEDIPDNRGRAVLRAAFRPQEAMRLMVELPRALILIREVFSLDEPLISLEIELKTQVDYSQKFRLDQIPIVISEDLIIAPTFYQEPLDKFFPPKATREPKVLRIDPGAAFGTGRHPTSFLCLKLLTRLKAHGKKLNRILDIGAGSGILSLASSLLFPEAVIIGIDNDPDTIDVANENKEINHLEGVSFSASPLDSLEAPFDLIFANITLGTLLELSGSIEKLAKKGTILILSGILEDQAKETIKIYAMHNFVLKSHLGQNEWSALEFIYGSNSRRSPKELLRVIVLEPSLETMVPKPEES